MRRKTNPWGWHKTIWFSRRIPTHSFIMWMALRRGLKTLSKIKVWCIVQSYLCVHYWQAAETEEHLFFKYMFDRQTWWQLKIDMGYGRMMHCFMEDEMRWIKTVTKGNNIQCVGVWLTFCAYVYWMWKCRNEKIFKGRNCTIMYILKQIKTKMEVQQYTMKEGPERMIMSERWGVNVARKRKEKRAVSWNKPAYG